MNCLQTLSFDKEGTLRYQCLRSYEQKKQKRYIPHWTEHKLYWMHQSILLWLGKACDYGYHLHTKDQGHCNPGCSDGWHLWKTDCLVDWNIEKTSSWRHNTQIWLSSSYKMSRSTLVKNEKNYKLKICRIHKITNLFQH